MKASINILFMVGACALLLGSCKKDETRIIAKSGTAPALSASPSTLVLNSADADKEAIVFTWTASDYGYNAAVKYTLQFDKSGNNFANAREVSIGSDRQKKYNVADFNALAIQLGLTPGSAGKVDVRVKSEISTLIPPVYSNAATITVTPYQVIVQYPSLYVPGSYQGWTPAKAEKIASPNSDKIYEGYVYFPDVTTEFKFTDSPDWSHGIFGDAAGGTSGNISSPGDNFKVSGAGYYLLKADLNANKWSATKTTWGIIGDATAGGWGSDQDMIYDAANKVWIITADLTTGAFKFRANHDWGINLGDYKPANTFLKYGGENIPVSVAGKYKIVLNLSNPGNYTYTVTKL